MNPDGKIEGNIFDGFYEKTSVTVDGKDIVGYHIVISKKKEPSKYECPPEISNHFVEKNDINDDVEKVIKSKIDEYEKNIEKSTNENEYDDYIEGGLDIGDELEHDPHFYSVYVVKSWVRHKPNNINIHGIATSKLRARDMKEHIKRLYDTERPDEDIVMNISDMDLNHMYGETMFREMRPEDYKREFDYCNAPDNVDCRKEEDGLCKLLMDCEYKKKKEDR